MDETQLVQQYCKTLNPKLFKALSQEAQMTFLQSSIKALKIGTGNIENRKVAKDVLKQHGFNDRGDPLVIKEGDLRGAEHLVQAFDVNVTGARPGDILVGTSQATRNSVIKIYYGIVGPEREKLNYIRQFPDLWKHFVNKLNSIPFFANMTLEEKEEWLYLYEDDYHLENIIGSQKVKVEILQPGALTEKVDEANITLLMEGNENREDRLWEYSDVYAMIPKKDGSMLTKEEIEESPRYHTLFFIRSFWKIGTDYKVVEKFGKAVINVMKGNVEKGGEGDQNMEIIVLDSIIKSVEKKKGKWENVPGKQGKQDVGFLVSKHRMNLTNINMNIIIKELFEVDDSDLDEIRDSTAFFTPAAYKSLIQKIIRFRPDTVTVGEGDSAHEYDTEVFLCVAFTMLLQNPGSFVPDIQRFVSGLESAAKRTAVTIFEDSSVQNHSRLLSLLSGALLAQRAKTWKPSSKTILAWLEATLMGYRNTATFNYSQSKYYKEGSSLEPYVFSVDNTPLQNCSALLNNLQSFASDENMVYAIAKDTKYRSMPEGYPMPETMPLGHCVDQHWAPGVVFYYMPQTIQTISTPVVPGQPFKRFFGTIWDKSSSLNPRKQDLTDVEDDLFLQETRFAQNLFLYNLQTEQINREATDKTRTIRFTLDKGWLAALVGGIRVKVGTSNITVTLRADEPTILVAIRTPARDKKPPLTPDEEYTGIEKAKVLLHRGIPLNQATPPIPELKNTKVVLINRNGEDVYVIRDKHNNVRDWNDMLGQSITYPLYTRVEEEGKTPDFEDTLTYVGDGIQEEADDELNKIIQEVDDDVLRRVMTYLFTFSPRFEINRISRDGGGTYKAVSLDDVPAYQFMLRICLLYPGALRPVVHRPQTFSIPSPPLLWHVQDIIQKNISGEIDEDDIQGWSKIKFTDKKNRELWEHQVDSINELIEDHKSGKKGSFLWLDVGLGKTLIILKYLQYLKENNELPRYIVYSLPKSAITAISEEIEAFDIPINFILPIKSSYKKQAESLKKDRENLKVSQSCEPVPYKINLIEHDKLRICEKDLLVYSADTIFIIDEVHKALNDTQRTSAALQLCSMSREFIVLTGTPVIDNQTYKLIQWLKMIVPFEVNEKNFWVAANTMIAKQATTGIKTIHEEVEAPFTEEERKYYYELVPQAMGGSNTRATREDLYEATQISYSAMDREIVRQVHRMIKDKRHVFLVAENRKHQEKLYALLKVLNLKDKDVLLLQPGESVNLTRENIKKGVYPDYKVVIVPQRYAEGYTMTALSAMISGAYPSNQATRTQLEGRINRIGQTRDPIIYVKVHAGTLTYMLEKHMAAKNLETALRSMADDVGIAKN